MFYALLYVIGIIATQGCLNDYDDDEIAYFSVH